MPRQEINAQQDDVRPAPKIKSNSEQIGYKKRDRKPGRPRDFMNDPAVIAQRQGALARMTSAAGDAAN